MKAHFTGKERDSESGLDYFGARYYGSALGRFTSPDWSEKPEPVPYVDLSNPQSLNLYNYMRNNPLSGTDPDGHCCEDAMDFGEELASSPSPLLRGAGYVVIGGAAIGTALTDPKVRGAVTDTLSKVPDYVAQNPATPGPYVGPLQPIQASATDGADSTKQQGPVKAKDAPGTTASGQATDKYGNKLGPSGETQINKTNSNTREGARNKALNEGSKAVSHNNPKDAQGPHYHPADAQGEKKLNSPHHYYPDN